MNLRKIIIFPSLGIAITVTLVFALTSFIPSYNSWKDTYDTVMEDKENRKLEPINGVTVKQVYLEKIDNKPNYVISGKYDETVNPENLSFKLYTYNERANYAKVVNKEIDRDKQTFKMYSDVSLVSADGDGNPNYNNDCATSILIDAVEAHALYPKLVINNVEKDLVNSYGLWHGETLEFNNCVYKINHNRNTDTFPFSRPALLKTTNQEIPETAFYTASGVELTQIEDDVFFIIHGNSEGYNRETLSKIISFDFRVTNSGKAIFAIRGTQGGPVLMEDNGDFKLYARLNNVPISGTNPYYSRFGQELNYKGDISDLLAPGVNGTYDQKSIIYDGREYIAFINHGSGAINGYYTSGVKVRNV